MTVRLDVDSQAAAWFSRWRSGEMSESERAELRRWLAASEQHRLAYNGMEALWLRIEAARAAPRVLQWRERARRHIPFFFRLPVLARGARLQLAQKKFQSMLRDLVARRS